MERGHVLIGGGHALHGHGHIEFQAARRRGGGNIPADFDFLGTIVGIVGNKTVFCGIERLRIAVTLRNIGDIPLPRMFSIPFVGAIAAWDCDITLLVGLSRRRVAHADIGDIGQVAFLQRVLLVQLLPRMVAVVIAAVGEFHIDVLGDFQIAIALHLHIVVERFVAQIGPPSSNAMASNMAATTPTVTTIAIPKLRTARDACCLAVIIPLSRFFFPQMAVQQMAVQAELNSKAPCHRTGLYMHVRT